jgi:hypothetical protein
VENMTNILVSIAGILLGAVIVAFKGFISDIKKTKSSDLNGGI